MRIKLKALAIIALLAAAPFAGLVFAQAYRPGFFSRLQLGTTGATRISQGSGTPESAVTGSVGDLFLRTDGADGTSAYTKTSGFATTTGWKTFGTAASTDTFTNKTYNAESTGNVLTLPFTVWWQASHCETGGGYGGDWSFDVSATNAPSVGCAGLASSNTVFDYLIYDDAATEAAFHSFRLPDDWTGTVDLKLKWFTSATSGNVVWQVSTVCLADNENMDPSTVSYNTAQTITDAAKASGSFQNDASLSNVTMTGCAAGELLYVKMLRNPAHASDTISASANLLGIGLTYRRAM